MFQRKTLTLLPKTLSSRLVLLMLSALICSTVLSLLAGTTGEAYAANTHAQSAASTHGGGCNSDGFLESCVSVNSAGQVVSDAYVLYNRMCDITIEVIVNNQRGSGTNFGQCYSIGTHLVGSRTPSRPGYTYWTDTYGRINPPNVQDNVHSPLQYT